MSNAKGFTLVEMMIAVLMSGILVAAVLFSYETQKKTDEAQSQIVEMQQGLRASLYVMTREIRMAGYDPAGTDGYGITDIRFYKIDNALLARAANSYSKITFTAADFIPDVASADETVSYSLYDSPVASPDGNLDLGREHQGGGRQMLAENIELISLAYAYDNDGDDEVDVSANGNMIWAIDSNNDNKLDLRLDTDDDGDLDAADDADANGLIDGAALAAPINPDKIRAVRMWILARTDRQIRDFSDTETYVVGDRVSRPTDAARLNDSYRRRLLTMVSVCRNMGL